MIPVATFSFSIRFFSGVLNSSVHLSIDTPNMIPIASHNIRALRDSGESACHKLSLSRSNFMFSRRICPQ
jgi:hypothetical protein